MLTMVPPVIYFDPQISTNTPDGNSDAPNIILLVFDPRSERHISLYGYSRKTTSNLNQLAENAIIYHNHFANGHFTVPSKVSLLTDIQPWTRHQYQSHFKFGE